ncbi:unnamed protein product [Ranitomeya imitator]|uniref:Chromo domain-containing protein n=1 Tax=Ranitomeya imitator TaxID=111125 RepID=A0ABN9LQ21_9NEOB|nr:unnamed protein product [Ranitomeya imitator]
MKVKVQAVLEWPRPECLKLVQRFLGFANYYRKFIKNFSVIAKPINDLTKKGSHTVQWSPEAAKAFEHLKERSSSAPVFIVTDETKPFLVEVDASSVGVGAVLSQKGEDGVHPCAFFSKKISETELNYDVGNRELLAIKLAFEHCFSPAVNTEKEECILQRGVVVAALGSELESSILEAQNAAPTNTPYGYHPESKGQTERKNQDVEQFLRCFVADNQEMWSEYLPLAEFALRRHPSFGPFSKIEAAVPEEEIFSGNLDRVWTNVRHNLKEANRRSKKYFDKKRREALFAVGDIVWLSSRNLHLKIPSKKLGNKFVGPFKVVQVVNSAAVRLDIPSYWRINSVFHVSLLKKVDTPDKEAMPTAPRVDEDGEFEISCILDSRWHRGRLQYLVSWKGFGPEDNSWVKAEDVLASRLIKAFHRRFPNKARPRGSRGSSVS